MNLITSLRMQLKGMTEWYKNALITNVVLDYLELETDNPDRNVQIIQELIASNRIRAHLVEDAESFFVDGVRVLTIYLTKTDITGGKCEPGKDCTMEVKYKFCVEWRSRPEKALGETTSSGENNVISIHAAKGTDSKVEVVNVGVVDSLDIHESATFSTGKIEDNNNSRGVTEDSSDWDSLPDCATCNGRGQVGTNLGTGNNDDDLDNCPNPNCYNGKIQ